MICLYLMQGLTERMWKIEFCKKGNGLREAKNQTQGHKEKQRAHLTLKIPSCLSLLPVF